MAPEATAGHGASPGTRFALAKFRPTTLPATLVTRTALHDRLAAGAGQRLTVVIGSAGAGKSVLLSNWAATRPPGLTSWLSCDAADANLVRFWAAFIEAPQAAAPWLEQRDLDTAERLTEQALSITERRRPMFEFLALLDRAGIWAARGQVPDALATVEAARRILAGTGSVLLTRADELEARLRLSLGDLRSAAELADGLPADRRGLLQARIALAAGDHQGAREHLRGLRPAELTPRHALVRQILLAAAAIARGDPMAASIVGGALHTARNGGFLGTVVTTAPQVTSYLIEHSGQAQADPFTGQLIAAALQVRAAQPGPSASRRVLPEPLTAAELRVLKLLPTSGYLQTAATLHVSRNTVKTHLRSVYQKLGATSRAGAVERAIDLGLL